MVLCDVPSGRGVEVAGECGAMDLRQRVVEVTTAGQVMARSQTPAYRSVQALPRLLLSCLQDLALGRGGLSRAVASYGPAYSGFVETQFFLSMF